MNVDLVIDSLRIGNSDHNNYIIIIFIVRE